MKNKKMEKILNKKWMDWKMVEFIDYFDAIEICLKLIKEESWWSWWTVRN